MVYTPLNAMAPREIKEAQFYGGGKAYELATVHGQDYLRDEDGTWLYADSWVKVPGARDLTLSERFEPKFIVSSENEVERVVISGSDIAEEPELLGWCLEAGTQIRDDKGELVEVIVPVEIWAEHNRVPGEIVAPEHSEDQAERELAEAERQYREADRALELAAASRADVLRRHADTMTRQEARLITGLSVGRIQQLIRGDSLDEVERLVLEAVARTGPEPSPLGAIFDQIATRGADIDPNLLNPDLLRRNLNLLHQRSLVERLRGGYVVTDEGRDVLEAAGDEAEVEAG